MEKQQLSNQWMGCLHMDSLKIIQTGWLLISRMSVRYNYSPVVVYGHKNPYMIVCFLACVKSGRAYCPVDTSVPESRVQADHRRGQQANSVGS